MQTDNALHVLYTLHFNRQITARDIDFVPLC